MKEKLIVGICDDEEYIVYSIKSNLIKYEVQNDVEMEIKYFSTGMELLEKMPDLDLLFLDIDMPELDGIETARLLNRRGISYKIILLTCKLERFKDGFKIGAIRFVTKPVNEQELFEAISNVRFRIMGLERVSVYLDGKEYNVSQRDILYIMADKYQTKIFTTSLEYRSENSLVKWQKILEPKMFIRTHKSFIVNLSHVESYRENIILLPSKEKIPLSRRLKGKFLEAYMEYDTKYR